MLLSTALARPPARGPCAGWGALRDVLRLGVLAKLRHLKRDFGGQLNLCGAQLHFPVRSNPGLADFFSFCLRKKNPFHPQFLAVKPHDSTAAFLRRSRHGVVCPEFRTAAHSSTSPVRSPSWTQLFGRNSRTEQQDLLLLLVIAMSV